MHVSTYVWHYACIYACMYECMQVWMYFCKQVDRYDKYRSTYISSAQGAADIPGILKLPLLFRLLGDFLAVLAIFQLRGAIANSVF